MASAEIRTGSLSAHTSDRGSGKTSSGDLSLEMIKKRAALEAALDAKLAKAKADGDIKAQKSLEKQRKQIEDALAEYRRKKELEIAKETAEEQEKLLSEMYQSTADKLNEQGEALADKLNNIGGKIAPGLTKGLSNTINAIGGSVEKYLSIYTDYMASINARVQGAGAGFNFQTMNDTLRNNTALNPYIKYTEALANLNTLVAEGIADNVVQRAFLNTIKDEIATTFDAAQSSLLEIVRIQQRDSTAARLGMEAGLTRLFNYYFSDTSYLNSEYDAVQAAMIDLSAQLDEKTAVELEYIVQKWLGSLGSVGVSNDVLQSLAKGITYLGTGNVNQLSSDQALQNLLVMASNRAGLDYSSMLTGGITASQANTLLASVISYVQEIAGSANNVVKQQYAQLFGLSIADMRAFQNINSQVLDSLLQNGMTYSNTLQELNSQIGQIGSRLHLSTMVDNVIENAMAATGVGVLNSPAAYGIWKAADMLETLTGGIQLPFISVLGSGLDLNMTLEGLIKGGVVGISAIGSLVRGLGNLGNGMGMGSFNAEGVNNLWNVGLNKGGGFVGYQNAGQLSTSSSSTSYVSSGNELGIQQSLADSQKETGTAVQGEDNSANETLEILRALDENLKALWDYFDNGGNVGNPLHVQFGNIPGINNTGMPATP